jgi:Fe(3+) dicitrate transport protein
MRESLHNFYVRAAYTFLPTAKFTGVRLSSITNADGTRPTVTGNRLPYAPEHLLSATFGYAHPSGFDGLLEAVHVSSQFADDRNFREVPAGVVSESLRRSGQLGLIPGYTAWNATANYRVEHLRTTFFFTVKNLFDRTYVVDRTRGLLPSSPRLLQGGLKFRF